MTPMVVMDEDDDVDNDNPTIYRTRPTVTHFCHEKYLNLFTNWLQRVSISGTFLFITVAPAGMAVCRCCCLACFQSFVSSSGCFFCSWATDFWHSSTQKSVIQLCNWGVMFCLPLYVLDQFTETRIKFSDLIMNVNGRFVIIAQPSNRLISAVKVNDRFLTPFVRRHLWPKRWKIKWEKLKTSLPQTTKTKSFSIWLLITHVINCLIDIFVWVNIQAKIPSKWLGWVTFVGCSSAYTLIRVTIHPRIYSNGSMQIQPIPVLERCVPMNGYLQHDWFRHDVKDSHTYIFPVI